MITKETKTNQGQYNALYEVASTDTGLNIANLDQFFANYKELANKALTDDGNKLYLMLPLDEPTFDIDADTRTITVPTEFKKNGISVKGDAFAETLYFTVDRYFDNQDLLNTNVVIQWEAAAKDSKTASETGVSPANFVDAKIIPGKLVFGWYLNSHITKYSGTIKFAVRFYTLNSNKELDFSLSTLTASASINAGLDFAMSNGAFEADTYIDDAQTVANRFKDSVLIDAGTINDPEFIKTIIEHSEDCIGHILTINNVEVTDLTKYYKKVGTEYAALTANEDLTEISTFYTYDEDEEEYNVVSNAIVYHLVDLDSVSATLGNYRIFTAEAVVQGARLSYNWYKKAIDDKTFSAVTGVNTEAYELTTDTELDGQKVYYTKTADSAGQVVYTAVASPVVANISKYYEKVTSYTALSVGDYYVEACAKTTDLSHSEINSEYVRIPGPAALTVEYSPVYRLTTDTELVAGKTYYTKDEDSTYTAVSAPVVANIATYYEVEESYEYDNEGTKVQTLPIYLDETDNVVLSVVGDTARSGDKLTYVWSAENMDSVTEDEKEGGEVAKFTGLDVATIYTKTSDTAIVEGKTYYELTDDGYVAVETPEVASIANYYEKKSNAESLINAYDKLFKVSVTASRNGATSEAQEKYFRVTAPAVAPKVTIVGNGSARPNSELVLSVANNGVSDKITYQWFLSNGYIDGSEGATEENDAPDTAVSAELELTNTDGSLKWTCGSAGRYFCKVTNHANNSTATAVSTEIVVG